MLYRGVDKMTDEKNSGRLIPKGSVVAVVALADGKWPCNGTMFFGTCLSNTARAHQIDTGLYGGAGISTSRSEKRAIFFATSGYMEEGYVYVIDETKLAEARVTPHEFSNPIYPDEMEVTLIERSGGALPEFLVIEKYEVASDGSRVRR